MKKRNIITKLIFTVLLLILIGVLSASYPAIGNAVEDLNENTQVDYNTELGFTKGSGWFYWPGTTDKTNFGYTMRYDLVNEKVQGNLLIIRYLDNGDVYWLKSKDLFGLALGQSLDPAFGWASFSGEATYYQTGWPEPLEDFQFLVYVEDWGRPGAGFDQFWIEVRDGDEIIVNNMSMERDAIDNTETLLSGNIFAPH